MKKHQFVKIKCDCKHRATNFVCKHCGVMEFCSPDEVKTLDMYRALCTGAGAPEASPVETFKAKMGGTFDCLASDFETWENDQASSKK